MVLSDVVMVFATFAINLIGGHEGTVNGSIKISLESLNRFESRIKLQI